MSDDPNINMPEPSAKPGFEMFEAIVGSMKFSIGRLGRLVQVSWLAMVLYIALMFGFVVLAILFAADTEFGIMVANGDVSGPEFLDAYFDFLSQNLLVLMIGSTVMSFFAMQIIAIPTRAMTELALDRTPQSSLGLFYLHYGSMEMRIGLAAFVITFLAFLPSYIVQFLFIDQIFQTIQSSMPDPNEPPDFREMMRYQALMNGMSLASLGLAAFLYSRFIAAIPMIVEGQPGLCLRRSWALTRGNAFLMFGYAILAVIGGYFAFILLLMGVMIAAAFLVFLLVAISAATEMTALVVVVGVVLYALLMLMLSALAYGYLQSIQVKAYQWLMSQIEGASS